ncbi:MAG: hypothetical protein LC785_16600 [Acidobacteria bacterium]|nr:hypothetical protein [Acidobacteriota bacterium]
MSFRSKFIVVVFSASLALYAVVGGWMFTSAQQQNDPGAQLRIFESVLQHINDDYVDEPDLNKVRAGALRGLAYGLDPYSTYLTVDQVRDYKATSSSTSTPRRRATSRSTTPGNSSTARRAPRSSSASCGRARAPSPSPSSAGPWTCPPRRRKSRRGRSGSST